MVFLNGMDMLADAATELKDKRGVVCRLGKSLNCPLLGVACPVCV